MSMPQSLTDVECVVHDFTTGAELASGRCDVTFIEHTDRLRMQRAAFEGIFRPASEDDLATLRSHVLAAFSTGMTSHMLHFEFDGRTYALTVRFEIDDAALPFTGRSAPKIIL